MHPFKINNSKHPHYDTFRALYAKSFPIFEQRTAQQQEIAFNNNNYHLMGLSEDDLFIGFIAYWEFDSYIYIEHLAINDTLRGKGYGSKALQWFEAHPLVVLTTQRPITEQEYRTFNRDLKEIVMNMG